MEAYSVVTVVRDVIALGNKLKGTLEKVTKNRVKIQRRTSHLLEELKNLETWTGYTTQPPGLLMALERLKSSLNDALQDYTELTQSRSRFRAVKDGGKVEADIEVIRENVDHCIRLFQTGAVIRIDKTTSDNSAHIKELTTVVHNLATKIVDAAEKDPAKARRLVGVRRLSRDEISSDLLQARDNRRSSRSALETRYLHVRVKTLTAALREAVPTMTNDRSYTFIPSKATSSSTRHGRIGDPTADSEDLFMQIMHMKYTLQDDRHSMSAKDIANRLDKWSVALYELGMFEEACEMSVESVQMHEKSTHGLVNHNLATALHNYSNHLNHVWDGTKEALKASQRAEGIFRRLINDGHETFNAELALSLNNTANCLRRLGHRHDALDVTREAVTINCTLSHQHPDSDAFHADYASSLGHFSSRLLECGRRKDALKAAQSARDLYHHLYLNSPDVFAAEYASLLKTFVDCLSSLQRHGEAVRHATLMIQIWRDVVKNRPNVFRCQLAQSLGIAYEIHNRLGDHEEALRLSLEAADQYHDLSDRNPEEFLPEFGLSLRRAGNCLMDLEAYERASGILKEALRVFEECAKTNRTRFKSHCADALDDLYICFSRQKQYKLAFEFAERAVRVLNGLVKEQGRRSDLCARLATSHTNVFHSSRKLGFNQKAFSALKEAIGLYRDLVGDSHADIMITSKFSEALYNLSMCLGQLKRSAEALKAAREALEIHQNFSDRNSEQFKSRLDTYLENVSICQKEARITATRVHRRV